MPPKDYIVIPAYNEGTVICGIVAELIKNYSVVVVDDGSMDDTSRRGLQGGAVVLRHPINLGAGAAVQTGIDYALLCGAKTIVTFDADGQHLPSDVEQLLQALHANAMDVVIGSRFLGHAENLPFSRRILLRLAAWFTWLTGGPYITDVHNGLRAFRAEIAPQLRIYQSRYAHCSEILYKIKSLGLKYKEVPVTVKHTDYSKKKGQSGLSGAFEILVDLIFAGRYR